MIDFEAIKEQLGDMSEEAIYSMYADMSGYECVPVSIDQFLEDPFYLGDFYGNGKLYPAWKKELIDIFPNPFFSPYDEITVTGSIGIGKTVGMGIPAILYSVHKLLCIKNPHDFYNLIKTDKIAFAIFTPTLKTGGDVLWGQIEEMITSSPYFISQIERAKKEGSREMLPKHIGFVVGSNPSHGLGRAIFGAVMDEANFSSKASEQAKSQYNTLKQRMTSRFKSSAGSSSTGGHMIMLSSRNTDADFLEKHIEAMRNVETTKSIEFKIWEVKPDKYSKETFPVFCGNDVADPFIITSEEQYNAIEDKDDIIQVPVDIRQAFELDIYRALRDLAGMANASGKNLIKSPVQVENVCTVPLIQNKEIISIPCTKEGAYIQDFINVQALKQRVKENGGLRFIHIDLSTTGDLTGIACAVAQGTKVIRRMDSQTGVVNTISDNTFHIDFALAIKAVAGQEIPYFKIREFIKWLKTEIKMRIHLVTTDGFQSVDMRQMLTLQGFKTDKVSTDLSNEPYLALKNMIVEERIAIPNFPLLKTEIKELRKVKMGAMTDKYDHPENGSKDVADAVACSVYKAYTSDLQPAVNQDTFLAYIKAQNKKNEGSNLFSGGKFVK